MAKRTAAATSNLVDQKGNVVTTTANETAAVVAVTEAAAEGKAKGVNKGHRVAVDVYGLTAEQIAAAIAEGQIANVGTTVVQISADANKGKAGFITYEKLVALNFNGQGLLCGGKEGVQVDAPAEGEDTRTDEDKAKGATDHFNYGFDLEVKRELRRILSGLLEGPEKAIKAAVQTLLDNGLAENEDEALAMVKASRLKKGLPI
jgi:hypothetical protein